MAYSVFKCYAVAWSYGVVCVGCGCCRRGNHEARLKYELDDLKQHLKLSKSRGVSKEQRDNATYNVKYTKQLIKNLRDKIRDKKAKEKKYYILDDGSKEILAVGRKKQCEFILTYFLNNGHDAYISDETCGYKITKLTRKDKRQKGKLYENVEY
jgi:hypothetical protein